MSSKHNFRLSALMTALALGTSAAAAFAHAGPHDASFADSMAVGGDTSTTDQRVGRQRAEAQPQPVVQVVTASNDMTVAEATTPNLAPTERPATRMAQRSGSASATASATDLGTASSDDSAIVASSDIPLTAADDALLILIAQDDTPAPTVAQAVTEMAAPPLTPVAALEQEIITREQVRDELRIARAAGTLSRSGELSEPQDVLLAREEFNVQQADAIVAEYRAQQERQLALAEADSRRVQLDAEANALAQLAALAPSDDPTAEVRIEVLDISGE